MTETVRRKHKRPRPQSSCAICHRRKVRCDKKLPCGPCQKHGCADECRFDGIPAQIEEEPSLDIHGSGEIDGRRGEQHENSITPSNETTSQSILTPESLTLPSPRQKPAEEYAHRNSFSTTRFETHDWPSNGPWRGRTHTSGVLQHLDPIMRYLGSDWTSGSQLHDDGTILSRSQELNKSADSLKSVGDDLSNNVYDEMAHIATSCDLMLRYFQTWDTVFPLVDQVPFGIDYNNMLANPRSVPVCFVLNVLVMQALANATYPANEAPIAKETVRRWLDLASAIPVSAMAFGEIHVHSVQMFALINLADQVLSLDSTGGYIKSGVVVRSAMIRGLHLSDGVRLSSPESGIDEQKLWHSVVEIDQHACLAAGMPPSVPSLPADEMSVDGSSSHDLHHSLDQTSLQTLLVSTLPIRHKILVALNGERRLRFEQVVELSGELTRAFAPVSTREDVPEAQKTFQYKYISFVYARFLAALHRPFATMSDPAFYLSRSLAVRLSKRYLRDLSVAYRRQGPVDHFDALLPSNGIIFRSEALQALLVCCHEVIREDNAMQMALSSPDEGRTSVKEAIKDIFGILEERVQLHELPERFFLAPAMVYAHCIATARTRPESEEYRRAMAEAGREALRIVNPCAGTACTT
ncbi:Transcription factor asR3 [Pseudocercospora fuligena]|uniref:Transcription factor asR3 n=1 Tax=Pseudocercospora fuligena TaxID=685502 RepID=A0A8H6RLY9_9PEZI|nr:Transcription factor asR3 [Pseudocercospora fuligena]